jgi:hypothetical protein
MALWRTRSFEISVYYDYCDGTVLDDFLTNRMTEKWQGVMLKLMGGTTVNLYFVLTKYIAFTQEIVAGHSGGVFSSLF